MNERLRFDWVVEQAHDGYLLLGMQGEIRYANASTRLLLDLPDGSPSPASFHEHVQRTFHCEPQEEWRRWFSSDGQPPVAKLYLVRAETETAPVLWLEVTVLAQDDRFGMEQLVQVRDVTSQLTSQRDTWAFHSMIMHKLNTPLQTVVGGLEMLSPENISELSTKEIGVLAALAYKGTQRLRASISDILQYVKAPVIARDGQGISLGKVPALIARVSNLAGRTHELRLTTALDASHSTRRVSLSPRAVESILWELLENAQKFHPSHAPTIDLTLAVQDDHLQIKLVDDGTTLSPTQIAKVWQPYYQAEKHFTGEMPGMGLGLPMVATMVWEAGGTCKFYNRTDGPGVVVDLWLPII